MSIIEVAKRAGVSPATVSRVLNEVPGVQEKTIRQVQAAIKALNYSPPAVKRGPKQGSKRVAKAGSRTGTLAVLTLGQTRDWLQLPVMASVVAGISRAARDRGFRLVLDELPDPDAGKASFLQKDVGGAIVFLAGFRRTDSYAAALVTLQQQLPIVWVMGMEVAMAGIDHVTYDNIRTGYLALEYLRDQGCEHVAFLTPNPDWQFMRLRGQSFSNAAFDAGRPASMFVVSEEPTVIESYGTRAVSAPTLEALIDRFAAARPRPTGLFCGNDMSAAQVYPLLAARGIRPGHDLTVIGCDNEEIRLSALHPRPATIDIGAEQVGSRAVKRLLYRMEDRSESPIVVQVAPRLIPPTTLIG